MFLVKLPGFKVEQALWVPIPGVCPNIQVVASCVLVKPVAILMLIWNVGIKTFIRVDKFSILNFIAIIFEIWVRYTMSSVKTRIELKLCHAIKGISILAYMSLDRNIWSCIFLFLNLAVTWNTTMEWCSIVRQTFF